MRFLLCLFFDKPKIDKNLKLRYAFDMRTLIVEPEIDGSILKVRISDAYFKYRAGYF